MNEISLVLEPPIARIRLHRPDRRNAMSRAMWRALPALCAHIASASEALVVIVEGSEGHFCAGADLSEFETVFRDAEATHDYNQAIQDSLNALVALDRPTIAAVRGSAIGGGMALALCCDLRFCADDAFLAIPPAKHGLLYGFVETRRLVQTIGPARAKDLLFSARRVECAEALTMGLIDRLVEPSRLEATVLAYARELASLSQYSVRGGKMAIDAIAGGLDQESPAFRALVERAAAGEDFAEARSASRAKRAPEFRFRGRLAPRG
ncbi:enoyl-CoA hydratase/isomerase family protein [Methylocapsa sp. S129]|uniref:enoyl-CoA hydratase/isomerase family protein n=1 Tax=Methylocapsa sp. S129 TaxID=1641869 RepID=UPI00131B5778|nr:enoyl-CoA hydratase/isomerase family protein [Methylocapsa sp. S129]